MTNGERHKEGGFRSLQVNTRVEGSTELALTSRAIGFFINREMHKSIPFWHISLPNSMELIPAELFLIRDGPLGGTLGVVEGSLREADALTDGLHLESGRRNFLTGLQWVEPESSPEKNVL